MIWNNHHWKKWKLQQEDTEKKTDKKQKENFKMKQKENVNQMTDSAKQPDLLKLMTYFDYLYLFDRQNSRINVMKENWVMYFLSLLLLDIVNIIARESDSEANNYDYIKNLLFKHFKMTAEEFRQKFVSHRKKFPASWYDFAF